jgi:hypothetical protein
MVTSPQRLASLQLLVPSLSKVTDNTDNRNQAMWQDNYMQMG